MLHKRKITAILVTVLVMGAAFFASSASANSIGRCADHHINTGLELYGSWQAEGVTSEAVQIVSSAGYRHIDGDLKSWMKERVVKMKTAEAATFVDYGCNTAGGIFGAGTIAFPKDTTIMAALPKQYGISDYCGIKAHKGCEKVTATACSVGKVNCSNPLENCAKMYFFVKKEKALPPKKKHHHKKHHKKKQPIIKCKEGTVMIGNVCSPQTVNQKQECEVHSGSWNENTLVCVQVGVNGVCSAQNGVVNGNNNTINQEVNCGPKTEICVNNSCNTVIEEKPCGCPPEEPEKPSIMITGKTELNMIPAGKTSGAFYINVNASKSGGTLTVDPGIGGISSCTSTMPEDTITTSVPSGASKQCVIIYAPADKDKPSSMTITMTANLGSAFDKQTETVLLTYPTRPE